MFINKRVGVIVLGAVAATTISLLIIDLADDLWLEYLLGHGTEDEMYAAAQSLGKRKTNRAINVLVNACKELPAIDEAWQLDCNTSESSYTLDYRFEALVHSGDAAAAAILPLLKHKNWLVRLQAIVVLYRLDSKSELTLMDLRCMAQKDSNKSVRQIARMVIDAFK